MNQRNGVVAVVITYNPDLAVLGQLLDSAVPQVDEVILVDNGDGESLRKWLSTKALSTVSVRSLGENKGVAEAQNVGIEWARSQGARQVLIFDHDSVPPHDLVSRLQTAFSKLEATEGKVAAVGPRYIDKRWRDGDMPSPFVELKGLRMIRHRPTGTDPFVPVDFLISSGCLISLDALGAVGGMDAGLFIDYVDIEWGLRARRAGWGLFGVWDIEMQHSLGDDYTSMFGREFAIHSATRHYYMMRNALWLCLQSTIPRNARFIFGINAVKKFIAYSLLMPKPFAHFRLMCLGLWHGMRGRMGRL